MLIVAVAASRSNMLPTVCLDKPHQLSNLRLFQSRAVKMSAYGIRPTRAFKARASGKTRKRKDAARKGDGSPKGRPPSGVLAYDADEELGCFSLAGYRHISKNWSTGYDELGWSHFITMQ